MTVQRKFVPHRIIDAMTFEFDVSYRQAKRELQGHVSKYLVKPNYKARDVINQMIGKGRIVSLKIKKPIVVRDECGVPIKRADRTRMSVEVQESFENLQQELDRASKRAKIEYYLGWGFRAVVSIAALRIIFG